MQALGEGLGQPVGERLDHDRRCSRRASPRSAATARRRRCPAVTAKPPMPVGDAALLRRDEVGQRQVGPVRAVSRHLLAQRVDHARARPSRLSSAYSSMSSSPTLFAGQKPMTPRAVSQCSPTIRCSIACASAYSDARRLADHRVVQDLREAARAAPRSGRTASSRCSATSSARSVVVEHASRPVNAGAGGRSRVQVERQPCWRAPAASGSDRACGLLAACALAQRSRTPRASRPT